MLYIDNWCFYWYYTQLPLGQEWERDCVFCCCCCYTSFCVIVSISQFLGTRCVGSILFNRPCLSNGIRFQSNFPPLLYICVVDLEMTLFFRAIDKICYEEYYGSLDVWYVSSNLISKCQIQIKIKQCNYLLWHLVVLMMIMSKSPNQSVGDSHIIFYFHFCFSPLFLSWKLSFLSALMDHWIHHTFLPFLESFQLKWGTTTTTTLTQN